MDTLITLLALAVVGILIALAVRALFDLVTVHDYERGLRYTNGRFTGLVTSGTYPVFRPLSEIRVLDGRPAWQLIEAQEVPSADGIALKVSLAARYVVGDPVAAVTGAQDHRQALYLQLQLGLRESIAGRSFDEALASRTTIGPEIAERCGIALARLGIELLEVQVRDLIVPNELKRAFAGVVAARKEGEAALERARGETAALRGLANAGRLVEDNPGLIQLRVLQQLGASSGNTVMLGMPESRGGGRPVDGGERSAEETMEPGAAVRSRARPRREPPPA